MTNRDFVSRVSNQAEMLSKDDYRSDRYILKTGWSVAEKFISQRLSQGRLSRDMSLYREVPCIEFEPVDVYKCDYIEFKGCDKLSKSTRKIENLIYTSKGSSIKEFYSIDRNRSITESTLYQLRVDKDRKGYREDDSHFYILNDYIYIIGDYISLNGLILHIDQHYLDSLSSCNEYCDSVWDKQFICPDNLEEDVINYTLQNIMQTKQIPKDEKPNMNNNEK